jgi:hypothetical protein
VEETGTPRRYRRCFCRGGKAAKTHIMAMAQAINGIGLIKTSPQKAAYFQKYHPVTTLLFYCGKKLN